MKKIIVTISTILLSNILHAQDVDTKKFCIYQNQLYSAGSIISMNNQKMECVRDYSNLTYLIWKEKINVSLTKKQEEMKSKQALYDSPLQ
jgi:hypothetical protein